MTQMLQKLITLLVAWLLVISSIAIAAEKSRPNILLITADNLGYGDLPCFNSESKIKTPNFDRLATSGAKLTQFYTASPTCTVSRACLMIGRIPQRHGLIDQLVGIEGNYGVGLNPDEVLIPQVLRTVGYATGCFGKWNIGFATGSRPTERGFDEFFGNASGNIDYYTHNYKRRHDLYHNTTEAHVEGYSTDLYADEARDFISRHRDQPWFVYLPFNAPHFPDGRNKAPGEETIWQAPDIAFDSYGYDPGTRDKQQRYRAVVTALDSALGRVLKTLDELQLTENTFVFFYSGNGTFMLKNKGLEVSTNAPLRDGGVTCWEGGLRVAAIVRWPGQIEAGSTINQPLWSPDLMIACAKLAEADLPSQRKLDGLDPLPVLTRQTKSPHESFYFVFRKHAALRMGDWKIVRPQKTAPWLLFNLGNDIGETNDLAKSNPQQLAKLIAKFQSWE